MTLQVKGKFGIRFEFENRKYLQKKRNSKSNFNWNFQNNFFKKYFFCSEKNSSYFSILNSKNFDI